MSDSTGRASPGWQSRTASVGGEPFDRLSVNGWRKAAVASLAAGFADAPDPCPQRGKLFLDSLVAAIEMVNAVDRRPSLRHQTGDHEASGGAQIGRHHIRSGEPAHALDDSGAALDLDVRAEALELLDVHHPVFEYRLGDHRCVVG